MRALRRPGARHHRQQRRFLLVVLTVIRVVWLNLAHPPPTWPVQTRTPPSSRASPGRPAGVLYSKYYLEYPSRRGASARVRDCPSLFSPVLEAPTRVLKEASDMRRPGEWWVLMRPEQQAAPAA